LRNFKLLVFFSFDFWLWFTHNTFFRNNFFDAFICFRLVFLPIKDWLYWLFCAFSFSFARQILNFFLFSWLLRNNYFHRTKGRNPEIYQHLYTFSHWFTKNLNIYHFILLKKSIILLFLPRLWYENFTTVSANKDQPNSMNRWRELSERRFHVQNRFLFKFWMLC
jgi:hypothetical protein